MTTENVSTLKIHKMSQEQYERELAAGRIEENAIYLTPDTASMEIDDTLSTTSTNPVQNKVVAQKLSEKLDSWGNYSTTNHMFNLYAASETTKGDGEPVLGGRFLFKMGDNDVIQLGYGGPEGENIFALGVSNGCTINGKRIATEDYVTNTISQMLGEIENGTY